MRFHLLLIAGVLVLGLTPAYADIAGFQFGGITAAGDFSLNARIGKTSADTEHVINLEDCKIYQGQSIEIHWSLNRTPLSGTKYAVKMSQPGGACSTTSISDLGTSCYEDFLVSEKDLSSAVDNSFLVPMDAMMGSDCNANTDKVTNVYIVLDEGGTVTAQTIAFEVDLQPPSPPAITDITPGDTSLRVSWEDQSNAGEDGITYKVYWCPQEFTNSNRDACKHSNDLTALSYQISGLENNKTYFIGVSAKDKHDNEGLLSELSNGTPVEVQDFFEHYKDSGGKENGDFCFIATAAWGTKSAKDVVILRHFRDRFLMTSPPGRWFVRTYYALSPPIARFISHSEPLKAAVRLMLTPLVLFARMALWSRALLFVLLGLWLLGVGGSIILFARKK